jgi:glycosyltransferase involved in cell wall biosynthesis
MRHDGQTQSDEQVRNARTQRCTTSRCISSASTEPDALLSMNDDAYMWLVRSVQSAARQGSSERTLQRIEAAACFAAQFHTGRFADGAIENPALQAGVELQRRAPERLQATRVCLPCTSERRHVVHVTTRVSAIGGHTRMLYHWVGLDRSARHSLVLTAQTAAPVPGWLHSAIRRSGGALTILPDDGICQRALRLREIVTRHVDLVVLHHFGADVVPIVAFAVPECPPVAVLNHADHLFWLGSSVADAVINLRTAGSRHTEDRRFVPCNAVLPVPLAPSRVTSRQSARRQVGIGADQLVLLSVGRASKYRPCGAYDFPATAGRILERRPNAHLYVVGAAREDLLACARGPLHPRMHCIGPMEDPSLYRAAADVYVESFPFGSQTALLEAALSGLPVVPAYAPMFPLLVANDDALEGIVSNPRSELEYLERVDTLLQRQDERERLGQTLQASVRAEHTGQGWLNRLGAVYRLAERLQHAPKSIPIASSLSSRDDVALAIWHAMSGRTYLQAPPDALACAVLPHAAYVAKEAGDYRAARRYAWRSVLQSPKSPALWRLLVVALMGRGGRLAKRAAFVAVRGGHA